MVHVSRRIVVAFVGLGLFTLMLLLAFLDARNYDGKVLRNTTVAGTNIGGYGTVELDEFIADLDGQYRTMPIRLAAPGGGPTGVGADFGVSVDRDRLRAEALNAGRPDGSLARLSTFVLSRFQSRTIDVPADIDRSLVATSVKRLEGSQRVEPQDPKLELSGKKFVVVPGRDGAGIDPAAVVSALPSRLKNGPQPVTLTVNRITLKSRYSAEQVEQLAQEAGKLTAQPLKIIVGDKGGTIPAELLRSWVQPTIVDGVVRLGIDQEAAGAGIRKILGRVGKSPRDARLEVTADGTVQAVPAENGLVCCTDASLSNLGNALENPSDQPTRLEFREVEPKLTAADVERLGVKELIGTSTTKHKAGEDRVKNIHHIADLLRGKVILPGETFSVNKEIGPRSAANGFFKARVIEDGVFAENYGGGISQFATTMFNAAFYSGLDLIEYQSHSLYFKRYPYGVEATLSYPAPDLKIRNNTPYGVLIWPTYTASSITVNFYSTAFVKGEKTKQEDVKKNLCTIVITTRTRTYVDGRPNDVDKIRASYRPEEGVDCNGNPTAGVTTTTTRAPRETRPSNDEPDETRAPRNTADSGGSGDSDSGSDSGDSGDSGEDTPATTRRPRTTTTEAPPEPEPTAPPATPAPPPADTLPPALPVNPAGPPVTGVG
jgi:vancomycin resistance protein YoaR